MGVDRDYLNRCRLPGLNALVTIFDLHQFFEAGDSDVAFMSAPPSSRGAAFLCLSAIHTIARWLSRFAPTSSSMRLFRCMTRQVYADRQIHGQERSAVALWLRIR